jgi:hypothetical protein
MSRRRVLAVTTSPLPYRGQITDGPGYRMWNALRWIAPHHEVRVLSLYESFHMGRKDLGPTSEGGIDIDRPRFAPHVVARAIRDWRPDVLYLPWSAVPFIGRANRDIPTLLDFVGPGLLEYFVGKGRVPLSLLRVLLESFWAGDRFLTTTSRERHYLIGLLAASKRLSIGDLRPDNPLVHLARMTPPVELPPPSDRKLDGSGDEMVVLAAGTFLPWYDYQALVRAMERFTTKHHPRVRFVVMGGNPRDPTTADRTRKLFDGVRSRGLVDVLDLVPFHERTRYYSSADVGLLFPPDSVEDELSARTRVVDYLWAGLPIVTPGRDEYSTLALYEGAGFRYGQQREDLQAILEGLASDRGKVAEARGRIPRLLEGPFDPRAALKPFVEFLEHSEMNRVEGRPKVTARLALELLSAFRRMRGR